MHLSAQSLAFGYRHDAPVLSDVSFEYRSPGSLCVLGANGAGKSTLLQCLMGMLEPTAGRVLIDGREARTLPARQLARKVAYIPQSHAPSFAYRVIDVVAMGRTAHLGYFGSPGAADRTRAQDSLDFLGIGDLAAKPYTEVSGGERQLVMIAAALTQQPDTLILDEPTAHLDFGNQYRFIRLMECLRDEGMGVVMTTHAPDHALMLAGPTAVLADGRLQAVGPADEVVTEEAMSLLYGIDVAVRQVGRRTLCVAGGVD
ncbi:ABC transporter ATP-binding protein [Eggerthellaceae bacterium zg-1084]|uniref:ABC transporter ATP-binding protein n=1 Tax=Berryella wangjianweii TaxID=2734634 RepID=UPI00155174CA|nr:ABC transporter ATP-binding protein [Berryella wangjianweii]NPD30571.1 ABC transporter ATP-binding protein [Berryella wangjianweii]